MILPTPSLVLNSSPLDSILAFHDNTQNISMYPPTQHISTSNLLLVTPSKQTLENLIEKRKTGNQDDSALLKAAFPNPQLLSTETDLEFRPSMYSTLENLRSRKLEAGPFNATAYLEDTALLRLEDDKLPGPEYDIPYQEIVRLRPEDEDQGFLWENMYSTYKDRRYRVCGLNQMSWPPKE
jgi:hypothetical protein